MESRKSDIDGNCTFCHSKHCNNRPEEPISKNWSTYGTDFTTPIKDAGYYNYYMVCTINFRVLCMNKTYVLWVPLSLIYSTTC